MKLSRTWQQSVDGTGTVRLNRSTIFSHHGRGGFRGVHEGKDEVEDDPEEKQTHFGVIPDTKKEKFLKRVSIVVLVCPVSNHFCIFLPNGIFPGR